MGQNFSYWEQKSFLAGYDVIIIGSGIVGLSAALNLKQKYRSFRIGVLESGFLPSGASTKNAGFACFGSISEALDEIRELGEDSFLDLVEMRWTGLKKLRKILGDDQIDFHQYGGYEVFRHEEETLSSNCIGKIEYINNLLKQVIGKHDIYAVSNAKIADFGFSGVNTIIENKYEGQIDTGKMISALISKTAGLGVRIFNNCQVREINPDNGGYTLVSKHGKFRAKAVILATNAFARELIPELDVIPGRGQVLVTQPIKDLKVRGTFHYNRGYSYFRNIDNRILLGGFRDLDLKTEQTTGMGLTDIVQNALENFLHTIILPGQTPGIEYRWSGIMGFGPELKPIVRELRPKLYCAVRCSGMGVAMGSLLGEQVADLVEL